MDIDEALELVKGGKAVHHRVMFDKDGKITENEEESERMMETVYNLKGELLVEAS